MGRGAIVLDSGALSALAAREGSIRVFIARALEARAQIIVPTVVVAESTTGSARDAGVNAILAALTKIAPLSEAIARNAAFLRYHAKRPLTDTIDAIVVATADAVLGTVVLTADVADLTRLAAVRSRSKILPLR